MEKKPALRKAKHSFNTIKTILTYLFVTLIFCALIALFLFYLIPDRRTFLANVNKSGEFFALRNISGTTENEIPEEPLVPEPSDETAEDNKPEAEKHVTSSSYALLQLNDDHPEVQSLQLRLMELGYLESDEPGTVYNDATEAAVVMFQRAIGADRDGIASPELQETLFSNTATTYEAKLGDSGTDIKSAQNQLSTLGYYSGKSTGYFGTASEDALKAFQTKNGLNEDGIFNMDDRDLLFSEKAKPLVEQPKQKKEKSNHPSKKAEPEKKGSYPTGGSFNASHSPDGIVSVAEAQLGKQYVTGDEGPDTFDCSGLVYYCLTKNGVSCGRRSAASYATYDRWTLISDMSKLKKGDILFFKSDSSDKVSHAAVYIGGGKMIDASSSNGCVVRRSATSDYWSRNFVCARRVYG